MRSLIGGFDCTLQSMKTSDPIRIESSRILAPRVRFKIAGSVSGHKDVVS